MKFAKTPIELTTLFSSLIPNDPFIEKRNMFGYPVIFINGNMCVGLHGNSMIFRLSEEKRKEFLQQKGTLIFEPMAGRQMKEYVAMPEAMVRDKSVLCHWINESIAYVKRLPEKTKKKRKSERR